MKDSASTLKSISQCVVIITTSSWSSDLYGWGRNPFCLTTHHNIACFVVFPLRCCMSLWLAFHASPSCHYFYWRWITICRLRSGPQLAAIFGGGAKWL